MDKKTLITIVAIVAILGSLVSLYFTQFSGGPRLDFRPYEALGSVSAEETAKLANKSGSVVLMVADPGEYENKVQDAQLEAFTKTLKKNGMTVKATQKIKMGPMMMMDPGAGISAEDFRAAVDASQGAAALVSFVGYPELSDEDIAALKEKGLKFVAVSTYGPAVRKLLESEMVTLALLPRFDAAPQQTSKPKTDREYFDRSYVIITPDKVDSLPY